MRNIAVIGGGASGLVSAIYASKNNKVTIFERNSNVGKKILLTGAGKCNYYNSNQDLSNYNSNDKDLVKNIITIENQNEIINFFDSIGIVPKIKNGYYYPKSGTSYSIREALYKEAILNGVQIINDFKVTKIIKENNHFIINPDDENLLFDKIILATGSKAFPKTGSDGIGYDIATKFGHHLIEPKPALVQLIGEEKYFKDWAGIRCDVKVSLYEDNKFIKKEEGEIQLTNYGLSGICILNLSGRLKRGINNHKEDIHINFLPFLNEKVDSWLDNRNKKLKNRNIIELLESLLNYKLLRIILKQSNIGYNSKWDELTSHKRDILINNLIDFKVKIKNTNSFDQAQVCSGGVKLSEIDTNTMESNITKGLYIVGELLDVDGLCGGYNLTFAWISGMIAGKSV